MHLLQATNLKYEGQGNVPRRRYSDLYTRNRLICIGQNHTHSYSEDLYFLKLGPGEFHQIPNDDDDLEDLMLSDGRIKKSTINGGPSCFGDSGGPLWKVYEREEDGVNVPVLTGVFSFTLWGVCRGSEEPGKGCTGWRKGNAPPPPVQACFQKSGTPEPGRAFLLRHTVYQCCRSKLLIKECVFFQLSLSG